VAAGEGLLSKMVCRPRHRAEDSWALKALRALPGNSHRVNLEETDILKFIYSGIFEHP
jgi:hypothetical protein